MRTNTGKNSLEAIKKLIDSVDKEQAGSIEGVFIDETLREFFYLKEPVVIPSIPVSGMGPDEALGILKSISSVVPRFLAEHIYMEKRNPASEEHAIHLAAMKSGKVIDFIHILRLDFKFSAHPGTIVKKGNSATFPSYRTERIYFYSRLVPVRKGSSADALSFIRLKDADRVESEDSGKRLFTSVLFDDFSSREISIELSRKAGDVFNVPVTIYPMLSYDYFTSCLNVPDPAPEKLTEAAGIFEPLFLYLLADSSGSGAGPVAEGLDAWADCLELSGGSPQLKHEYSERLKKFFSCYSLFADDELLIKGIKKISSC